MKKDDCKNILVTGGIPSGTYSNNVGPFTDDEEKTIRINVLLTNEILKEQKQKEKESDKSRKKKVGSSQKTILVIKLDLIYTLALFTKYKM